MLDVEISIMGAQGVAACETQQPKRIAHPRFTHEKKPVVQRPSNPTVNRGKQPLYIVLDEPHTLCVCERTFEPR